MKKVSGLGLKKCMMKDKVNKNEKDISTIKKNIKGNITKTKKMFKEIK